MRRSLLLICSMLFSLTLYSQEIEGSRSFSMSEAFSAVGGTNEALYKNAAGMSLFPNRYNVDLSYHFKNQDHFNIFALSILDTTNFPLGAGFSFAYMWGEDYKVEKQGYRLDLGFSYPLMQKLIWGFDIKYVRLDIKDIENAINAATVDTGLLAIFTKWMRASIYGQNLIYVGRDELPMRAGAGVMIGSERSLFFAGDTVVTSFRNGDKRLTQSIGATIFLLEMLSISAGYKYDQSAIHNNYLSLGLGLFSKTAGIEAGYRQSIEEREDFQIISSIKLFME